jgi:hypothetical protein
LTLYGQIEMIWPLFVFGDILNFSLITLLFSVIY